MAVNTFMALVGDDWLNDAKPTGNRWQTGETQVICNGFYLYLTAEHARNLSERFFELADKIEAAS
jgi:hypothetical protein